ncbi:hypothetical protein E4V51_31465, partial [Paenibacillus sp. 28ISP30-2]|nr:hypothetical protein [Paenibacillus sp. 28ISP30-2]
KARIPIAVPCLYFRPVPFRSPFPNSTFYYEARAATTEDEGTSASDELFQKNRKAYGTRKIKVKLHERGLVVSRRRIGRVMKEQGLVSTYTVAQYKPHTTACNEAATVNTLNREFNQTESKRVVVSDLTYVKVRNQWHYICVNSEGTRCKLPPRFGIPFALFRLKKKTNI